MQSFFRYVKEGDLNKAQAEQAKLNSRIAKITQLGMYEFFRSYIV